MEVALRVLLEHVGRWSSFLYTVVQLSGSVVFFLGISLIVECTMTISRIVVPALASPGSLSFMFLCLLVSTFSFCILFNYVAAAFFCSPAVSAEEARRLASEGEALSAHQRWRRMVDAPARYCTPCGRYKVPREHHCRICRRCVAKMDHHCPWINNCVNAENQRYFFLFIGYLLLGTGLATPVLIIASKVSLSHGAAGSGSCFDLFPVVFTTLLCGAVFVCMLFFFSCSTLQLFQNETQIEWIILRQNHQYSYKGRRAPLRNPYDLGRRLNMLFVFETRDDPLLSHLKEGGYVANVCLVLWLMLPTLRPSACDGVHYPTFDDEVTLPV